ncbi:MAG: TetR/AcrR family transcriptional regulator [Bdellovibrionota bacterium]
MVSLAIIRPLRGQTTKKIILDEAMKIASIHGIQGVTIGELAKKVGMSKSGLFAHFENKDNLQLEILRMASEHFVESVMKPAFREEKGLPRIMAMFNHWLVFLNDHSTLPGGSIFISASFELDDRPGVLKDFVQKSQNDLILNMEKAVQLAIDCKHLKSSTNKNDFAWKLYSYILGYHHFKRMLNHPEAEELMRNAVKELIDKNRV